MSEKRIPLIPADAVGSLLVTKNTLAKACSVSERTIDYWRANGTIPALEFGPRFVRFDLAEVKAALDRKFRLHAKGGVKTKTAKVAAYKRGKE